MATFTTKDFKSQTQATAAGNGTSVAIGSYKKINVYISGTASTREVVFEISLDGTNWIQISGVNNYNFAISSLTTNILPEHWTFEVEGFALFRTRVANISGGNVSISGKLVK